MYLNLIELITQPWPWYVSGPLIGLTVPLLLLLGNKPFGISSNFRHICAACAPGKIKFLKYDWKSEAWNLFFLAGVFIGGALAYHVLMDSHTSSLSPSTTAELAQLGFSFEHQLAPESLFSFGSLRNVLVLIVGGFLVGFGTRYAGGCTSGHAISGLSNLQWPSLVAVIAFFIGGLAMTHFIFPILF